MGLLLEILEIGRKNDIQVFLFCLVVSMCRPLDLKKKKEKEREKEKRKAQMAVL